MAFYQLEPFGPERGDLQAAIVASTVANASRDTKKRRNPFEPSEFMPKFGERPAERSADWQGQLAMVEMLNAALGGQDVRKTTTD